MDDIKEDLSRIESKIDEHSKILSSMDKTLALQAQQIDHHIKRTDLAEQNLELLRTDFKPVQRHVEFVGGMLRLVTVLAAIAGASYYSLQIIKFLFNI